MYAHMYIIKIKYLHIFKEKTCVRMININFKRAVMTPEGWGEQEQNGGRVVHRGIYLSM